MQRSLTQKCTIASLHNVFTLPVTQPDVISPPEGPNVESHTTHEMEKTSALSVAAIVPDQRQGCTRAGLQTSSHKDILFSSASDAGVDGKR